MSVLSRKVTTFFCNFHNSLCSYGVAAFLSDIHMNKKAIIKLFIIFASEST